MRNFTDLAEIRQWNRSRTGSCRKEPSGDRPDGSFPLKRARCPTSGRARLSTEQLQSAGNTVASSALVDMAPVIHDIALVALTSLSYGRLRSIAARMFRGGRGGSLFSAFALGLRTDKGEPGLQRVDVESAPVGDFADGGFRTYRLDRRYPLHRFAVELWDGPGLTCPARQRLSPPPGRCHTGAGPFRGLDRACAERSLRHVPFMPE